MNLEHLQTVRTTSPNLGSGFNNDHSPDPATGSCLLDKSIKCEDICPGDVCKGKFMSDETCLSFALIDGPEKALLESGCERANEQILKTSLAPWEKGKPFSPCNKGFCKFVPGETPTPTAAPTNAPTPTAPPTQAPSQAPSNQKYSCNKTKCIKDSKGSYTSSDCGGKCKTSNEKMMIILSNLDR